ncbi:hypothetical protein H181DRAFT_03152 [Streptomyces sp. WMMB 714]|uniref:hypothetical protein n=1 Tax=Streptomyces sp. WMMB 714 TaxID=1286822 RepID=UPI0005F87634|nr:hypothetical protein [Streptomyces sp. WMMB 714]SCK37267.1 hypothetical protein H181DRAFT_03152 [Streptomyces sp. WMMB 714]
MPQRLNQWTPLPPRQDDAPVYGTQHGHRVTVTGDHWSCSGCGKQETAQDAHHSAQQHAAACVAVGLHVEQEK